MSKADPFKQKRVGPGRWWAGLALALGLAACTSWYPRTGVLAQPLKPRDQVRLCVQGECHQVHAVRVFGDSVSAIPYFKAPDCDSCEMHFAFRDLEAVQSRGFDRDKTIFLGLFLTPILVGLIYITATFPSD